MSNCLTVLRCRSRHWCSAKNSWPRRRSWSHSSGSSKRMGSMSHHRLNTASLSKSMTWDVRGPSCGQCIFSTTNALAVWLIANAVVPSAEVKMQGLSLPVVRMRPTCQRTVACRCFRACSACRLAPSGLGIGSSRLWASRNIALRWAPVATGRSVSDESIPFSGGSANHRPALAAGLKWRLNCPERIADRSCFYVQTSPFASRSLMATFHEMDTASRGVPVPSENRTNGCAFRHRARGNRVSDKSVDSKISPTGSSNALTTPFDVFGFYDLFPCRPARGRSMNPLRLRVVRLGVRMRGSHDRIGTASAAARCAVLAGRCFLGAMDAVG